MIAHAIYKGDLRYQVGNSASLRLACLIKLFDKKMFDKIIGQVESISHNKMRKELVYARYSDIVYHTSLFQVDK